MQDDGTAEQDVLDVPAADRALHSGAHDFAGLYIRHRASFTRDARCCLLVLGPGSAS